MVETKPKQIVGGDRGDRMNPLGFFSPVMLLLKLIFKIIRFIGLYWIIICMSPVWLYELIGTSMAKKNGMFLGMHPNRLGNILAPNWLYDITFYISVAFMALTLIQNIYRIAKKEPKFNIFKTLLGFARKNKAVGFVAKLNLDTFSSISGFLFGKFRGKYVTMKEKEDGHILICGGAGSGKSSCVGIPSLMTWKDRVFAIDIKGELYEKTSHKRGKELIKVFNPSNYEAFGYDPYYLLKTSSDRSSEAKSIAVALIPLPTDTKDPHWIQSAQNFLTGAILYFHSQGCSFSETMYHVQYKSSRELIEEIMLSVDDEAKLFMSKFASMEDKELGSVSSTMSNYIMPFATDKSLQQALDGKGKCITPNDLENGYDIFLNVDEHKLRIWKGLITLIVNQFCNAFEKRAEGNNKPILFLLDEFPRLGKIEAMVDGLATLRSKKIHIAIMIQSLAQLDLIYGKPARQVIIDQCSYQAILRATDADTQEYFSRRIGTYDKLKLSSNVNADMMGFGKGTGTSKTTEDKRIIKPEEFAFLKDIVCLFPTGYHRIHKVPYYEDKNFKN